MTDNEYRRQSHPKFKLGYQRNTDAFPSLLRETLRPYSGRRSANEIHPRIDKRNPDPRTALAAAIDASPHSYAALSRMLGRSEGYLRRFVLHGVPAALRPDEHRRLADYFGLDERALGVRDLWIGVP